MDLENKVLPRFSTAKWKFCLATWCARRPAPESSLIPSTTPKEADTSKTASTVFLNMTPSSISEAVKGVETGGKRQRGGVGW